jgi:glycerol-3-phosphate O-acyltransferase/dihydroxyacetone phosphate acyltransferase
VIVEFSTPYRISPELVEKYKKNKRDACGEMLLQVEQKMREVTLNAPSYKELKQLYMAREIYMPSSRSLGEGQRKFTAEETNEINKKFFKGFQSFRTKPELKNLLDELDIYMKELKTYNVQDHQVKSVTINFLRILANFLVIIPKLLINLFFVSLSLTLFLRVFLDLLCSLPLACSTDTSQRRPGSRPWLAVLSKLWAPM